MLCELQKRSYASVQTACRSMSPGEAIWGPPVEKWLGQEKAPPEQARAVREKNCLRQGEPAGLSSAWGG